MEYVVAFVVLATMFWIMCVKLPPRQLMACVITMWGGASFAPMAVALTRGDADAAADAGIIVVVYGLPVVALMGGIWLATRPHDQVMRTGSDHLQRHADTSGPLPSLSRPAEGD